MTYNQIKEFKEIIELFLNKHTFSLAYNLIVKFFNVRGIDQNNMSYITCRHFLNIKSSFHIVEILFFAYPRVRILYNGRMLIDYMLENDDMFYQTARIKQLIEELNKDLNNLNKNDL